MSQNLISPMTHARRNGAASRRDFTDSAAFHLRRAVAQDSVSLAWLMTRLTPFLRLQARYRLRGPLRRLYDPDDLVNDVWAITLPRLGDLRERNGALWPVLLRFLGATLLNRANQMIARELSRRRPCNGARGPGPSPLDQLPDPLAKASTLAERNEHLVALNEGLERLGEVDREVIVLRLIEEVPNEEVARRLGVTPGAVSKRLKASLERLRRRMPDQDSEGLLA